MAPKIRSEIEISRPPAEVRSVVSTAFHVMVERTLAHPSSFSISLGTQNGTQDSI